MGARQPTQIPVPADYPTAILGPTLLWAAGASIVTMPCIAIATAGVEPELAGLVAGLVNISRQTGGANELAALTTVAAAASSHHPGTDPTHRTVHRVQRRPDRSRGRRGPGDRARAAG